MANWQVMVQREQATRDRESKKLGQLLSRHAEYNELRLKTHSILTQYEKQLESVQDQSRLLMDTQLYRVSIAQMRTALQQIDGQIYQLAMQISQTREKLGLIERELQKYQLLLDLQVDRARAEVLRDEARVLDEYSIQRFNQQN
jgi:flagellar biosynthesis chaperone FliJ